MSNTTLILIFILIILVVIILAIIWFRNYNKRIRESNRLFLNSMQDTIDKLQAEKKILENDKYKQYESIGKL